MCRTLLLIQFIALSALGLSQAQSGQVSERIDALREHGVVFVKVDPIKKVAASRLTDELWNKAVSNATVLEFNAPDLMSIVQAGPAHMALDLPVENGTILLDLVRTDITASGFKVALASGAAASYVNGAHYRGMVRGKKGSVAAISFFGNEVMALINDTENEWVLGRTVTGDDKKHVIYRTRDLLGSIPFTCETRDTGEPYRGDQLALQGASRTTRCVRYYWEVDHPIFLNKGDMVNTVNYVTGLFNQSAILFDNDGIDVTLSEVFVWDVPSPYTGTTSGDQLTLFGTNRTSFNGDMAHLLGFGGGGGVAWLNTLCSGQTRLRMAYSGINSSYNNVPTYSWSVEVVTHEQGHNLGSRHTHACAWNGDGTAIDGCGPAAGYSEGSCPDGPVPSGTVKGTIMSYCHLVSGVGIGFNNGFGPQPAAVIVNAVNGASCLSACGTSCDPPSNLTATNLATTSATLSWSSIGTLSYTLRWKLVSSGTWTTVTGLTGNTYAISGLTEGTEYEFQVLSVCDASSSAYSSSYTFTTPVPCPDALEPNNTLGTAATITLPANFSALIATSNDVDYYQFILASTSNVNLSLSNLAGDFDVRLLDNTGAELAISQNGGSSSEYISYLNAPAGTYHIHIFGYGGAFSGTQCYALYVSAYAVQGCTAPERPSITAITWSSATVNWFAVQQVSTYDLRWKESTSSIWIEVNGIAGTTHQLSGLSPSTSYDVEVRSNCAGTQGAASEWSTTEGFTTLAAPCEVAPPILVSVQVLLDGPYRSANGLMVDSLRVQGLLPTGEPYSGSGFAVDGTASASASVFQITGPNAIVDWVLVELRDASVPTDIVETRAGLLQRDGDVVATDGTSPLGFCSEAGNYRVAVRHRNHLGVLTANSFALSATTTTVDLRSSSVGTYGTNARRDRGAVHTMWAGNSNGNTEVMYAGSGNDRDVVLSAIGGAVATATVSGYLQEDCNLDGLVKYAGLESDRDVILITIGGSVATATVQEQLP
jgi:hypothetical protein